MEVIDRDAYQASADRCAMRTISKLIEIGFDVPTVIQSFKTIIKIIEAPQESEK